MTYKKTCSTCNFMRESSPNLSAKALHAICVEFVTLRSMVGIVVVGEALVAVVGQGGYGHLWVRSDHLWNAIGASKGGFLVDQPNLNVHTW